MPSSLIIVVISFCTLLISNFVEANEIEKSVNLASGITLFLKSNVFDQSDHDISLCDGKGACIIDGIRAFGTAKELPRTEIVAMWLQVNNNKILLDTAGMYNGWPPREDVEIFAWLSNELNRRKIIRAEFSDGDGAYRVEWEITETKSLRTIIKCLECLSLSVSSFNSR